MFKVENADFIADKLASELLPLQENREVAKNAEEAILRRRRAQTAPTRGRIEFDVDWHLLAQTGNWYISCADNGDGMSRAQLERYSTTLAVHGANDNQSLTGNQGMGLKISGPTRHKQGVLIRSLQAGTAWMVQVGWDSQRGEYGLIPLGTSDEIVVPMPLTAFPDFVVEEGSGTVVTFLGNSESDNTFKPADRPRGWLFRYLHQRFYRFNGAECEMLVRVPSGDEEEWPTTRDDANLRMRGEGTSFNLSRVNGTAAVWDAAADKQGEGNRGTVEVPGVRGTAPTASVHWWVLPDGAGSDVSSRTYGGGTLGVLYQNELHDWRVSSQANPYFARMGVLYGKTRICFVIEPLGPEISSDFARAHVLVKGTPIFDSEAVVIWAEQFRELMPDRIRETMAEEQARLQADDPDRARRIRDRLKEVMEMLKPKRYQKERAGGLRASGERSDGVGEGADSMVERTYGPGRRGGGVSRRGIGAALSQLDDEGIAANQVFAMLSIEPRWVSEKEAETLSVVNDEGRGLHDRAAGLVGEDGATAPILALNRDFRGLQALVSAVNEWANPEGDDDKAQLVASAVEEWIEQKMIEAVTGLRQLENGGSWSTAQYDAALSPVALTASFMADRFHTLAAVKRQVGAVRTQKTAPSVE